MSAATPLPAPHDECASPGGLRPTGPTRAVVRREVAGLLARSAAFRELPAVDRISLEHHLNKVAGYAAECVRDDWASSARLGQRPVLVRRRPAPDAGAVPVSALAAGEDFTPAAAGNIAGVTSATLRALSFPNFVADLIRGTFTAIVNSSIQQMEAYTRLLEDVAKTVDQFMADNITDNQARDWLVQSYPKQIALANGEPRLVAAPGADDTPDPGWREALMLSNDVRPGDEGAYEEVLLPAARRKLAQSRLRTLSTLVLMGMNRITVTAGKLRAAMSFHVDTTDRAAQQHASDFDFHTGASGSVGFGPWSAAASMSVGYVRSDRSQSQSEMNVAADLTGEVEIHFTTVAVPLERFATAGRVDTIRANTAVPDQNEPPWGQSPPVRADITPRIPPPVVTPMTPAPSSAPPVPPIAQHPTSSSPAQAPAAPGPASPATGPSATAPPAAGPSATAPPAAGPSATAPPAGPPARPTGAPAGQSVAEGSEVAA